MISYRVGLITHYNSRQLRVRLLSKIVFTQEFTSHHGQRVFRIAGIDISYNVLENTKDH
jgi:hypothetical protein